MRPSNKLDFTKLEFFKILRVLGLVIYKLDLSDSIKITKIKHVLVLKSADLDIPLIGDVPDINPKN